MAITGGSFEFEERVTTGDYQHKSSRVIVQFDDPKDIGKARDLAMQQVRTALGIIEMPVKKTPPQNVQEKKVLAQIVEAVKSEVDANPGKPVEFPASDELPGPKFYTDAELIQACKDKQASGVGAQAIRNLIAGFVGVGKSVVHLDLDGSQREAFMRDLAELS